jgi:acetyl-CoA carboxylase carboxyltransferase component
MKNPEGRSRCTHGYRAPDYLAEDGRAIRIAREIVGRPNLKKPDLPRWQSKAVFDPDELLGIASMWLFEIRDIARIVDSSEFAEFKPLYGPTWSPLCAFTASPSAFWATTEY